MIKKISVVLFTLVLLTACSGAKKEDKVIKVASHMEPMTDVVNIAKEELAKEGWELELVNVSDNRQPNVALNDKEIDANFFQHIPHMEDFNKSVDGTLVGVTPIYDAIVGFYSKTYDKIEDVEKGAKVAIPNDPANEARALAILADHKIITLNDTDIRKVTTEDILENPLELEFIKVKLLTLTQAYEDVDLVYNYPTYIGKIGLTPKKDAVLIENSDSYYAISLVAREDNKDSDKIKALTKAMTSDAVRSFLVEDHDATLVPSF
ncbi:MetQ/NlpA family ABC transporter substrate-binding protein [Erysipelothrix urinaevulpis]|uniref:MetQ/NlpA family ABC transporter substrate-binding protein n=1 Tax=Erysipelothrix urinaevulpis TaxID=2683717 RepID=UPI00135979A4|nr:MetQ/NlpA family ABC transporter substrate-binding protein [Erysipelothrix urinaevulpis]